MIRPPVFHLDFAKSQRSDGRLWWLIAALLVLPCVWLTSQVLQREQALATADADIATLQRHHDRAMQLAAASHPSMDPAMAAVQAKLNIPWEALLTTLERQPRTDVTILSVTPDAESQLVQISMEATNLEVALNYVARLGQQPIIKQAYLLHQERHPKTGALRLLVQAHWKPR